MNFRTHHALVRPDKSVDKDITGLYLDISVFRLPEAPHRSDELPTLLAGHGLRIFRSDTFNLGAMSSFTVTRVASNHTIFGQEMQVSMLVLRLPLCLQAHALVMSYLLRSQLK